MAVRTRIARSPGSSRYPALVSTWSAGSMTSSSVNHSCSPANPTVVCHCTCGGLTANTCGARVRVRAPARLLDPVPVRVRGSGSGSVPAGTASAATCPAVQSSAGGTGGPPSASSGACAGASAATCPGPPRTPWLADLAGGDPCDHCDRHAAAFGGRRLLAGGVSGELRCDPRLLAGRFRRRYVDLLGATRHRLGERRPSCLVPEPTPTPVRLRAAHRPVDHCPARPPAPSRRCPARPRSRSATPGPLPLPVLTALPTRSRRPGPTGISATAGTSVISGACASGTTCGSTGADASGGGRAERWLTQRHGTGDRLLVRGHCRSRRQHDGRRPAGRSHRHRARAGGLRPSRHGRRLATRQRARTGLNRRRPWRLLPGNPARRVPDPVPARERHRTATGVGRPAGVEPDRRRQPDHRVRRVRRWTDLGRL